MLNLIQILHVFNFLIIDLADLAQRALQLAHGVHPGGIEIETDGGHRFVVPTFQGWAGIYEGHLMHPPRPLLCVAFVETDVDKLVVLPPPSRDMLRSFQKAKLRYLLWLNKIRPDTHASK
jgi:hypothetical protein